MAKTQDILNSLKSIYLMDIMEEVEQMELLSIIQNMEVDKDYLKNLSFQNYLFILHTFQTYKAYIKN